MITTETASRIPAFSDVFNFALELYRLGLAYHIDDDPREVMDAEGKPMFSAEEAAQLSAIVDAWDDEERDDYFSIVMELHKRQEQYFAAMTGESGDESGAFVGRP